MCLAVVFPPFRPPPAFFAVFFLLTRVFSVLPFFLFGAAAALRLPVLGLRLLAVFLEVFTVRRLFLGVFLCSGRLRFIPRFAVEARLLTTVPRPDCSAAAEWVVGGSK